jgi:hypothetical protein
MTIRRAGVLLHPGFPQDSSTWMRELPNARNREDPMHYAWRLLVLCTIVITGCSVANIATKSPVSEPVTATATTPVKGLVHGGQQPLQQASVYMFAVATTGYGTGNPSTSLLNSNTGNEDTSHRYYVTTDDNGGFTIAADEYSCTTGQQVYLYSVGGNAQVGAGNNPAAGLMAVLGLCTAPGTFSGLPTTVQMNEVTTVAAAYALSGFALDATDISGSSSTLAALGIANAALNAANLANLSGQALAILPAGDATVPQEEINTLADILASCINNTGGAAACDTLFSNAENSSSTKPTDTATAAINIAHNPGANVAALYGTITSGPPFQPYLTGSTGYAGPYDWTIAINFSIPGMDLPEDIAIDASGNAWIANTFGNSVVELSSVGTILSGSGYTAGGTVARPRGLAIDTAGNVWVANSNANTLTELNSSGGVPTGEPAGGFTGGGLNGPAFVAIDGHGNVWVSDPSQEGVSKFASDGSALSPGGGYAYTSIDNPQGIAIDGNGYVWIANYGSANLIVLNNSGGSVTSATGYLGGGTSSPYAVALDSFGNAWAADAGNNSISEYSNSGGPISPGPNGYTGGGLNANQVIALDGAGNVWSTGDQQSNISEFNSSGAPITGAHGYGYQSGIDGPLGIAVDGSGDVWVSDFLDSGITEFIGAAVPVITPICAGLPATFTVSGGASNLATRP